MTAIDLSGTWTGVITYGKEYRSHAGKELFFDMEIAHYRNDIAGSASDTSGFGMNKSPASIRGVFRDDTIRFLKQYQTLNYIDLQGETIVDETVPGPFINYSGLFDPQLETFSGAWFIQSTYYILWIIPVRLKVYGTWVMQRT